LDEDSVRTTRPTLVELEEQEEKNSHGEVAAMLNPWVCNPQKQPNMVDENTCELLREPVLAVQVFRPSMEKWQLVLGLQTTKWKSDVASEMQRGQPTHKHT
jgi:hypothetical protein